jgi:hypothetical protein
MIKTGRWVVVPVIATVAAVLGLSGPAFADVREGAGKTCGPDEKVKIASNSAATADVSHYFWNSSGQPGGGQSWATGGYHVTYTGLRSISRYRITSGGSIGSHSASCY